ncbi:hypothetical protein [Methylobacterium sp. J-090]|uniref:hypothetical protein n=1 Tax=Methylobacterium sp. J-090 TaxID=2836666 RepID=UPI001FBB7D3C|nr:hypothetical protein [Methylobacterium sp. J-090]MCJ2081299.1 hypothetical protein [Methylobacterium sp. J-090]
MVSNQNIGRSGEKAFSRLCSDTDLICNPSLEDDAGWDFFVQFPLDAGFRDTLDKRPASLCAFVQVKTSTRDIRSVEIKLNNAERMATEVKPAFIVVGRLDKQSGRISFTMGHIGPTAIAFILRELRKISVSSPTERKIKKIYLPISVLDLDLIACPSDVAAIIRKHSHNNLEEYIKSKISLVGSIGYKSDAYTGKFSISGECGQDRLVALMLGEIEELEVSNFEFSETRFEITVTKEISKSAIMRAEPSCNIAAIVVFFNEKLGLRAEYSASVRIPNIPNLEYEKFRVRIEHDLFAFSVGGVGVSNWRFSPNWNLCEQWANLKNNVTLVRMLSAGGCEIECFIDDERFIHGDLRTENFASDDIEDFHVAVRAVERLFDKVQNRNKIIFSINEFFHFMKSNRTMCYMVGRQKNHKLLITSTINEKPPVAPKDAKFVFPMIFSCGKKLLAVSIVSEGPVLIDGKKIKLSAYKTYPRDCEVFKSRHQCIQYLKISARNFCDALPDDDFTVIDRRIFLKKDDSNHLLSI